MGRVPDAQTCAPELTSLALTEAGVVECICNASARGRSRQILQAC